MHQTVFLELDFWALVASSILIPVAIFVFLMRSVTIARTTVLIFASVLIGLSAVDVLLLRSLARTVKNTTSMLDDQLFSSEISIALYVLPLVFAGIGVNLISHTIIDHLHKAERRFDQSRHGRPTPDPRHHDRAD